MSATTAAVPRRRHRVTPRALLLLGAVAVLLVALSYPVRGIIEQRGQIERLERQVSGLEATNADLKAEVGRLHDPAYVERLARSCLGMVRPGEIAFVTVPKGGTAPPPTC